jgi:hypothetical protein
MYPLLRLATSTVLVAALAAPACTKVNPAYLVEPAAPDAEEPAVPVDASAPSSPDATVVTPEVDATTEPDIAMPDATPPPPDAAPVTPDAGSDLAPDVGPTGVSPDASISPPTLRYTFETSTQGWTDLRFDYYKRPRTSVVRSTTRAQQGRYALEIGIDTMHNYTTPTIGVVVNQQIPAGTTITYQIWFPAGGAIQAVQPYVLYYRPGNVEPRWGGDNVIPTKDLQPAKWNRITHQVPADVDARGVVEVGMEWRTSGNQQVKVYMDAIAW